jgi:putative hydrolase of the HAD superfamily
MGPVKAIGFDLFNTLITTDRNAIGKGLERITLSLLKNKINVEDKAFREAHRDSALKFIEQARKDGKETHNSLWISDALKSFGYDIPPNHPIISEAVEDYFSGLLDLCQIIPGSMRMLETLQGRYLLGLLSNFTHAPAAHDLIDRLGLSPVFDVILISGELGYRKPHINTFKHLIKGLGVKKETIIYVGDDPEPDIAGARNAGLQPVWFTYVKDNNIPSTAGLLKGAMEEPRSDVPRISSWEDLLSLLPQ